jgi:hypothetical protein
VLVEQDVWIIKTALDPEGTVKPGVLFADG